nr:MAG TPA: DNA N-6-adenine-methyltransferase [Caudoviricetes sp.]
MGKKKESYEEFVEKFKVKKTTDDCYTPPAIYDVVLDYVKENCNIEGLKVMRPFYPGGDYENENYDEKCVVIDNPPFSIISQIIRFYLERNIKFFLFAPHLTLFGSDQDYTGIVVNAGVTYENGAVVKTSFVSNMFGDTKILGAPELKQKIKEIQNENEVSLPRYCYPDNVITVSHIAKIVERGESIKIMKNEVDFCRALEHQKEHKKGIFGSGFLVSDNVAKRYKKTLERVTKKTIEWELSDKEREIIKTLA